MADYAITASSVLVNTAAGTATINNGYNAGVAIVQGQFVYFNTATSTFLLANAATSAITSRVVGIALNSASAGQPISVLQSGFVTVTGTPAFANRAAVVLSGAVSGNCAPMADLTTNIATWYPAIVGIPISATSIQLVMASTGI